MAGGPAGLMPAPPPARGRRFPTPVPAALRGVSAPPWAARVVLIDPRSALLSVQFDAASPTLAQWRTRFPGALAIANGSFYSADQRLGAVRPTCDLVLAGKVVRGAGCRRQDALFFGAKPAAQPPAPPRSEG